MHGLEDATTERYHSSMWSGFLFAKPSFASGLARLLDLFGVFDSYNISRSTREADALALHSDWYLVGRDLVYARQTVDADLARQESLPFAR
jgi:hypothetical protein